MSGCGKVHRGNHISASFLGHTDEFPVSALRRKADAKGLAGVSNRLGWASREDSTRSSLAACQVGQGARSNSAGKSQRRFPSCFAKVPLLNQPGLVPQEYDSRFLPRLGLRERPDPVADAPAFGDWLLGQVTAIETAP